MIDAHPTDRDGTGFGPVLAPLFSKRIWRHLRFRSGGNDPRSGQKDRDGRLARDEHLRGDETRLTVGRLARD